MEGGQASQIRRLASILPGRKAVDDAVSHLDDAGQALRQALGVFVLVGRVLADLLMPKIDSRGACLLRVNLLNVAGFIDGSGGLQSKRVTATQQIADGAHLAVVV